MVNDQDTSATVDAAGGPVPLPPPGLKAGETLHRYVILEALGRGGMGVVYRAYDPGLDRKVALKLVARHNEDPVSQQRLLREAQALARLSHPNVVGVYDVGTDGNQVFIAMELLDGVDLAAWVRKAPRSWREIVAAYAQAGRGLAAAHAAGMVHRDVKPHNLHMDASGRVRVLDFGLAREHAAGESSGAPTRPDTMASTPAAPHAVPALASISDPGLSMGTGSSLRASLSSSLTEAGVAPGTHRYMAPEQHAGAPSPASDQYAFCVALFEALYGRVPAAGEKPTTPGPGPRALQAWLCTGLSAAPAARHASMDVLVDGLERILGRRRRMLATATVTALVALTGVTAAFAMAARDHAPRDARVACARSGAGIEAVWNPTRAHALTAHLAAGAPTYDPKAPARLVDGIDRFATAWRGMRVEACEATLVRHEQTATRLDQRVACLERKLDSFHAFVDVLDEMPAGDALDRGLGAVPVTSDLDACSDDAALRAQILPAGAPERDRRTSLQRRLDRADALAVAGKYDEGARIADEVVAAARQGGFRDLVGEALYARGRLEQRSGKGAAAETTLEQAVDEASSGGDQRLVARVMAFEVYIVGDLLGRTDEGIGIARAARGMARLAGDPPNTVAAIHSNLGNLYWYKGKVDQAFAEYTAALEIEQRVLGPEHPDVAWSWSNVGMVTEARGDRAGARRHYERAIALTEKALGAEHPEVAGFLNNLAGLELADGKLDAAEAAATRGLAIVERSLGPSHYRAAELHVTLGRIHLARGRFAEARSHCDTAHRVFVAADDGGSGTADALACRGEAALGLGDRTAGVKDLEEALGILEDHDLDPTVRAEVKALLAPALWDAGQRARALALAAEAAKALEGKPAQVDEARRLAEWLATHASR